MVSNVVQMVKTIHGRVKYIFVVIEIVNTWLRPDYVKDEPESHVIQKGFFTEVSEWSVVMENLVTT